MDDTFPLVNEAALEHVGISLQDLSQHGRTGNGNTLQSRDDEATTNSNPITRLNLDERIRRQLLEDVLGLLAQDTASAAHDKENPVPADSYTQMQQPVINPDIASQPKMSTSYGQSGYQDSTSQNPAQQISNLLIPLKDGYKLDLRDMSSQILPKNLKIQFDADAQNLRVKNVMRDVAKYGDKYAKSRTATKGVLTVSILLQNIAQLKSVIKKGQTGSENFWFLVVLIPLSLLIQIVGGALIIYVGNTKTETNEQIKSSYTINRWILYVSSAASLLNTVIASLLLSELNLDERTRRQLLEDVLGLLVQDTASNAHDKENPVPADSHTQMQQPVINPDIASQPKMSISYGQSGYQDSTSQNPAQQISNLLIPLKDGYKLDLRDMSSQILPKNLKIQFDADAQNLRVKNVMRDVAKYGDKYAKSRTAKKGVLTVSILLQNIAQLKSVIKKGQTGSENFWFLVVLIPLSLLIQIVGGALIIYVGNMKTENQRTDQVFLHYKPLDTVR